ncbi:MAG: hypothetical protein K6G22_07575 [Lachnospiraceae bacterium]|nr:hypothetical protein [Lachnospiraceae bacterium]
MRRNIDTSIKKFDNYIKKNERYDLYMSEMQDILIRTQGDPYRCMSTGYMHGFIVGYRAALRDLQKKEGRC